MFLVGLVAGLIGQSSGLIADSLDMFADAVAYGIALSALNRGTTFKARAAMMSGEILLTLGIGVLLDCVRRGVFGSSPESRVMMGVAGISLLVNATVLYLLGKYHDQGVHLRAAWIFTRVDVIANLAVVLSGLTILLTDFRFVDLVVGAAIGLYVIKEGYKIIAKEGKLAKRYSDHQSTCSATSLIRSAACFSSPDCFRIAHKSVVACRTIILRSQVYAPAVSVRAILTQMGCDRFFLQSADEQSEVHANLSEVGGTGWTTILEHNTKVILAGYQFASVVRQYNDHTSYSLRCDGLIWNVHSGCNGHLSQNEHR